MSTCTPQHINFTAWAHHSTCTPECMHTTTYAYHKTWTTHHLHTIAHEHHSLGYTVINKETWHRRTSLGVKSKISGSNKTREYSLSVCQVSGTSSDGMSTLNPINIVIFYIYKYIQKSLLEVCEILLKGLKLTLLGVVGLCY